MHQTVNEASNFKHVQRGRRLGFETQLKRDKKIHILQKGNGRKQDGNIGNTDRIKGGKIVKRLTSRKSKHHRGIIIIIKVISQNVSMNHTRRL